jgi:hypothetical protein
MLCLFKLDEAVTDLASAFTDYCDEFRGSAESESKEGKSRKLHVNSSV